MTPLQTIHPKNITAGNTLPLVQTENCMSLLEPLVTFVNLKMKFLIPLPALNPDGSDREIVHRGIRNSVGFDWHPETGELWFTDNGRDWLGDDKPECELNRATQDGLHFGYPYCHQGDIVDPKLGDGKSCDDFTPPAQKLGPHTAPLGMEFYTGQQFPGSYSNQIFIARHGSWNRSKKNWL